jgi:hypothetical protein
MVLTEGSDRRFSAPVNVDVTATPDSNEGILTIGFSTQLFTASVRTTWLTEQNKNTAVPKQNNPTKYVLTS